MAEELLGPVVRDPRRRARPRLPAPRERDRAVAGTRASVREDLDAQRDARFTGEKMSKSAGNVVTIRDALDRVGPRDAARLLPDRALVEADRLLGRDAGRRRGARPKPPRGLPHPSEPAADGEWERFAAALDDDFNTPEALAIMHSGATTSCSAARSTSSGSPRWPRGGGAAGGRRARRAAAAGARATATSPRPTVCAPRSTTAGWVVRDVAAASSSSRSGDARPVYGRRPVREALRGRRQVLELWATERALAAEQWLARRAVARQVKPERELSEAPATRDHQGVLAWAEPYRYADAWELAAEERPLIVCLDRVTDPRNLGAVCRSAEGAGATGVVVPAHGSAAVTPAVCQGLRRRGRAPAGRGRHEPRALPAGDQARRPLDLRRRGRRGARRCGRRTSRGGAVLVLGAEGRGCARSSGGRCDAPVSIPLPGRSSR